MPRQTSSTVFANPLSEFSLLKKIHDLLGYQLFCVDDFYTVICLKPSAIVIQKIQITVLKFQIFHFGLTGSKLVFQIFVNI